MDGNNRWASGVRHFRGAVDATLGSESRIDMNTRAERFEDWPEARTASQSKSRIRKWATRKRRQVNSRLG